MDQLNFWKAVGATLDVEFDAPDPVADDELCQAIIAGRFGLHPDAWGLDYRHLTGPPERARRWRHGLPEPVTPPKPKRRPVVRRLIDDEPKRGRPPGPARVWTPPRVPANRRRKEPGVVERRLMAAQSVEQIGYDGWGWLELTCDECPERAFAKKLRYPPGQRPLYVEAIRVLGQGFGWTCIEGVDRCPQCSKAAAPEHVGNGAGER